MLKYLTLVFAPLSLSLGVVSVVSSVVSYAAEIKVLSAGAVEPAIEAFAHQLKRDT